MDVASRPTVFIVDDDASVRRSLSRLVESAGFRAEAFESADQFIATSPRRETGCLVLDVRMPSLTGPQLQERMQDLGISLPVIFLTGHGDVPTSVQAMKRGAVDFLLKPVDHEKLLQAIRVAIDQHAAARTRAEKRHETEIRLARLTSREREVMQFLIGGHANKYIAAELGIAEKTVKVHRGRLMAKAQVGSVAELVRLCETVGIEPR